MEEAAVGNTSDLISLYFWDFPPFLFKCFLKEQGYETVYWGLWDTCKDFSPDKANLTISIWELLIQNEFSYDPYIQIEWDLCMILAFILLTSYL